MHKKNLSRVTDSEIERVQLLVYVTLKPVLFAFSCHSCSSCTNHWLRGWYEFYDLMPQNYLQKGLYASKRLNTKERERDRERILVLQMFRLLYCSYIPLLCEPGQIPSPL